MKNFSLFLKEINQDHLPIVGGKAYRLAELSRHNFRVPEAFVITTHAFDFFLRKNLLHLIHQALTSDLSLEDTAFFALQLKDKMTREKIPEKLELIFKKFDALGLNKVSLRSSATTEDGKENSFAGQFETFLDLKKDGLASKLQACWASLFSPRAVVYTHRNKIPLKDLKMAVIVQQMINPDLAGNLTTRNILGDMSDKILIEANKGKGDVITAGTADPERVVIDRRTFLLDDYHSLHNKRAVLSKSITIKLVRTALSIEKIFNYPQEIEWAIRNGEIFILQSRPLTIK